MPVLFRTNQGFIELGQTDILIREVEYVYYEHKGGRITCSHPSRVFTFLGSNRGWSKSKSGLKIVRFLLLSLTDDTTSSNYLLTTYVLADLVNSPRINLLLTLFLQLSKDGNLIFLILLSSKPSLLNPFTPKDTSFYQIRRIDCDNSNYN